jgi:hypothetical protein
MHANPHRLVSKLFSILAVTLFLTVGPIALHTIAELHSLLARISMQLCEIGLVVLRVCGI